MQAVACRYYSASQCYCAHVLPFHAPASVPGVWLPCCGLPAFNHTWSWVPAQSAMPRPTSAASRSGRLLLFPDKIDRRPFGNGACKLQGVPVRQTNAAVRLRFADFRRVGCSMNAITLAGQTDPNCTHRIVGPGLIVNGFLE